MKAGVSKMIYIKNKYKIQNTCLQVFNPSNKTHFRYIDFMCVVKLFIYPRRRWVRDQWRFWRSSELQIHTKISKLTELGPLSLWISKLLGQYTSLTISTSVLSDCVPSPFSTVYIQLTASPHAPSWSPASSQMTTIGLIQDGGESVYKQEVVQPTSWCSRNSLMLNTVSRVDNRLWENTPPSPFATVAAVESFKFLSITISKDLEWDTNMNCIIKKELILLHVCTVSASSHHLSLFSTLQAR